MQVRGDLLNLQMLEVLRDCGGREYYGDYGETWHSVKNYTARPGTSRNCDDTGPENPSCRRESTPRPESRASAARAPASIRIARTIPRRARLFPPPDCGSRRW